MLVKETTRNRTKIFHICDPYDIATIRALRDQEETDGLRRLKTDVDKQVDHAVEEEDGTFSLMREEANPLKKMQTRATPTSGGAGHAVPGSLQVINFHRTNLSYEFSSKYLDDAQVSKEKKAAMDPRE